MLNRGVRFNLQFSLVSICTRPLRTPGGSIRICGVTFVVIGKVPLAIMDEGKGLEFPHQVEKLYRLPRIPSGAA